MKTEYFKIMLEGAFNFRLCLNLRLNRMIIYGSLFATSEGKKNIFEAIQIAVKNWHKKYLFKLLTISILY